jgi:enoyl-CoA hydratase/carnithine racemase
MRDELRTAWRTIRHDPDVHVAILTAAGDRAFCTGIDRGEIATGEAGDGHAAEVGSRGSYIHFDDPGGIIGPKSNDLWKPIIAAVNGMACGGAFYLLGEVDVIIAAENATFFDPHVTYGMASVFESIHMAQRMPLGEVLRMQLTGSHERVSAQRAHEIGLVSEIVSQEELPVAARRLARIIASQPPLAVQATVRSVWTAWDMGRRQALEQGWSLIAAGTSEEALAAGQARFASGERVEWRLR